MDVRVEGGQVAQFPDVGIGAVEQDERHGGEPPVLEERAQKERVRLEEIDVGVPEAGVELEGQRLPRGRVERQPQEVVGERLGSEADAARASRLGAERPERAGGVARRGVQRRGRCGRR